MMGSSDVEGIAQYLAQTLNPSTRKQAEANLAQLIAKPQFAPILLELLSKHPDDNVKFSAAVYFKNFIKRKWKPDGDVDEISPQDREQIKLNIIHIMTTAPNSIILQLSEAVTLIANTDFPDKWGTLLRVLSCLILGYYWQAIFARS
jgi:exportin-2 (importin alpha re-exporter)